MGSEDSPSRAGALQRLDAGAVGSRPPLRGWLLKRKHDGSRSRQLCATNRRHFTIDFQSQVFFYAHAEASKSVSLPTPFGAILCVDSLEALAEEEEEQSEACSSTEVSKSKEASTGAPSRSLSKSSLTQAIIRPMRSLSKRSADQFGFQLRTTSATTVLFCSSKEEADVWITAFREAISMKDASTAASTAPGSSIRTSSSSSTTGATSPAGSRGGSDGPEETILQVEVRQRQEPVEVLVTPASLQQTATCDEVSPVTPDTDIGLVCADFPLAEADPPLRPPDARGLWITTQSFDDRPEADEAAEAHAEAAEAVDAVVSMGRDAGRPSQTQVTGDAWSIDVYDKDSPGTRYADKGEGLTLNQRLQQLQLSDSEDEEDDADAAAGRVAPGSGLEGPWGAAAHAKASLACPAPSSSTVVVEEAVQAFVREPDGDDD